MKKFETIKREAENVTIEMLNEAITNEYAKQYFDDDNLKIALQSEKVRFCYCLFNEMTKALSNKSFTLVYDLNYERQKNIKNKEDLSIDLFTIFSLLDTDRQRAIHYYIKKKSNNYCISLCFSVSKNIRVNETALAELNCKIQTVNSTNKTIKRDNISIDEVVTLSKNIIALLNNEYVSIADREAKKQSKKTENAISDSLVAEIVEA